MPPSRQDLTALTLDPLAFLRHADPTLRRMAVTALDTSAAMDAADAVVLLADDPDDSVRTAAAERLGWCGTVGSTKLAALRTDAVAPVREAVATAYGELRSTEAIAWLVDVANTDDDRQVREAAVASLGAIGDTEAIEPLLSLVASGPAQVRRRAIAAITVFDDPRVEPAIRRAALDRNPGVREAAEMVVGRQITPIG
jgi:HEAT repeat protein